MPSFSLKVVVLLVRAGDLVPTRSVGGGKKGVGLMEGVSAVEISVVANSRESPYDFIRVSFKGGGGAAKTGLGLGALDRVGTMAWGERGVGDKEISASSSKVGRLKELGPCFGVEGEVEPELDLQSEVGSPVVHIVDRD